MLSNYTKRNSITTYGGNSWGPLTGIIQVLTSGVATYYSINYGPNHLVKFDQYWNYQTYYTLPLSSTFNGLYVGGRFYFTAEYYFYRTDSNFNLQCQASGVQYRQPYYDSSTSLFYVAAYSTTYIAVFNIGCVLVQTINLGNYRPYGLSYFNGSLYVSVMYSNEIFVLQNGVIVKQYVMPNSLCSSTTYPILSITFDSYGYMAATCYQYSYMIGFDYNGNQNSYFSTSNQPFFSLVDSSGRFIVASVFVLDIYY